LFVDYISSDDRKADERYFGKDLVRSYRGPAKVFSRNISGGT
jgi:hypothetical protein